MDTHFFHYYMYEVDDDGQIKAFYALDDGAAFAIAISRAWFKTGLNIYLKRT